MRQENLQETWAAIECKERQIGRHAHCAGHNEALSSGEPKQIMSNVARGPKARGQHWKLLAEDHHLITSL